MIELKEFQAQASESISERFFRHFNDPPMRGTAKNRRIVPFYQSLSSITASGKTVILADAVSNIATQLPIKPVVIWMSKGKVVVEQSYANLLAGGRYHHLLGDAEVALLGDYDAEKVARSDKPLIYFATVGTFNQRDKEKGDRLIYRAELDTAESSTWDALKLRLDDDANRRPLLLVYDEGHNLSDQQMELLLELEPDALIAASATLRPPARLATELGILKDEGWTDEDLTTQVDASAVADSGLVKSTIILSGYEAPMEETLDALIADFRDGEVEADKHGVGKPKAIYVCKTNIVEGNSHITDDHKQPFSQRQAPPILIWRYLTEHCGVDGDEIAVYCSLKKDKDFPFPASFHLFSGGDKDYSAFTSGPYRHIIFNLSLQEGWDDPLAYFAYVDKSMESNVQVEQVIGRLLRQPDAQHYPSERLNTAHFYVRVDKRGTFNELIKDVNRKLRSDAPSIKLVAVSKGKAAPVPVDPTTEQTVFATAYDTAEAVQPIAQLLADFPDYTGDTTNTRSAGGRSQVQRKVGDNSDPTFVWEDFEHTNLVSARWLFQREVLRLHGGALGLAPTNDQKFDALIGFGSPAHKQLVKLAKEVVEEYLDNVNLVQRKPNPYEVGPTMVRTAEQTKYDHAVHPAYSDMNSLEQDFAAALDKAGLTWCRNPSRSGYGIPLITLGPTKTFYPDFLVWSGSDVYALDTTGTHLLEEKTGRKLLNVAPPKGVDGRIFVRFISEGTMNDKLERLDTAGYTVWSQKQDGKLRATHADDADDAAARAVKPTPQ